MKPYRYWHVNTDKTNSLFVIHVSGGSDMTGHAPPETRSVFPQDTRTGDVETGSEAVRDEANMGGTVEASTEINNTTFPTSSLGESSNVGAKRVDGQVGGGEALEAALCQLGPFGPYQRYVLTLLCLPTLLSAMYSFNYVFVAEQVPFRCVVPECEDAGASFGNTSTQALLSPEPCRRYAPLSDAPTCLREDFHLNNTIKCEAFIYENQNTIYAEFGLACREWLRTLVGSVRNAALPLALLLTGYTSDRWGRLTAFCIFSACSGVMGLIKSFSVNYQMYIALEFLEAALGYGFGSAAYVMAVELARPSLRAMFACATGVAYGVGGALLALAAQRLQHWRQLLRALHAPALLLPLYWLLLDDSVRWLHATARQDEAVVVLRKAARWNRVTLNEEILKEIGASKNKPEEKKKVSWLALVRTRVLLVRLVACGWCWAAAAFVYYGLTINAVALSGDKYINFALNMAMEIVASLLIMMALERFGRKKSILVSFLVCGVACIAPFFTSHAGTSLGLYFAGKLGATSAFNSLYVFSSELFPTGVRARALSAVSLLGRVGSVLAPQTPLLSRSAQTLLYGGSALSAALALLLLPETRREPLPH